MYCRKCGTRIRQGLEFCPKCGAKQLGNEQSRPQEAEEQRRQEEQRRHEEERRRRASAQTQPDTAPQPIPQAPATAAAPATTADGAGGKAGPNKSLLFVVVVIALLVGFAIYTNGQKSDDNRSDAPVSKSDAPASDSNDKGSSSDDTSATAEKGPDGYWWAEAVQVEDGVQTDAFMIVNGDDVQLGVVMFDESEVKGVNVMPVEDASIEYDSSSDELVAHDIAAYDMRFKRANEGQRDLADAIVAKVKTEGSGD